MNELVNYQAEAINLAHLTESSKKQTVVLAARTGAALIQVKELLGHGDYVPWIEANMPVDQRQCQRYVRLAQQKPELISNTSREAYLDIDSELKLLSLDDEVAEEVRDFALENDLTRKEIAELTKQLKAKETEAGQLEQASDEWRQQYLDGREAARELDAELKRVTALKQETIYVEDSDKALEQYREETMGKLTSMALERDKAMTSLKQAKAKMEQDIKDGVTAALKGYTDKIESLQHQETALHGSIRLLTTKDNELDHSVGVRRENIAALSSARKAVNEFMSDISILEDLQFTDEERTTWMNLLNYLSQGIARYDHILGNHPSNNGSVVLSSNINAA